MKDQSSEEEDDGRGFYNDLDDVDTTILTKCYNLDFAVVHSLIIHPSLNT